MNKKGQFGYAIFGIIIVVLFIGVLAWGLPKYNVYSRELSGKAALKEAEWSRQITVEEAKAEVEAKEEKKESE